ncbi:MAG: ATP-binding cassette domain-containing protein [Chromatiales bacterium]|nr:ATP-binding cassette domain-containing protein [Chromatiales bacterium]
MIELRNLALRRGAKALLTDTSLTIYRGSRVGVVGRNGSGKSSLFALLLGELTADEGEVDYPKNMHVGHVSQQAPTGSRPAIDIVLDGDTELRRIEAALQRAEAVNDGNRVATLHAELTDIDGYSARSRAERVLTGLSFSRAEMERSVDEFSGGWRMRLALAQALMARSEVLLLDEPTNHLDLDAVLWLEAWLRDYDGTLLLISHDRDFIDRTVDHVLAIENGQGTLYKGNFSDFEAIKILRLEQNQALHARQQRRVAEIQRFVDRFRAKATKARQAQSRLKTLERMERIELAHVDRPYRFEIPEPAKLPNPLLRLENAAVGYNGHPVVQRASLTLTPGKRIGLVGHNGAGKSTFIKLLAGSLVPLSGEMERSRGLTVGYFDQHQLETLDGRDTPLEFMHRVDPSTPAQRMRDYVGGFGFAGEMADAASENFSGGERARLVLAGLVWLAPNLLLLDEPTNHLDLDMRDALVSALQSFPGALVTVSHDQHMLRATTDELWLVNDGTVTPYSGDLDDYKDWLLGTTRRATAAPPDGLPTDGNSVETRKNQRQAEAERRKQRQPLKRQADKLEAKLEQLTHSKDAIEHKLGDPALYESNDRQRLNDLLVEQGRLKQDIDDTEAAWLETSVALEDFDQG